LNGYKVQQLTIQHLLILYISTIKNSSGENPALLERKLSLQWGMRDFPLSFSVAPYLLATILKSQVPVCYRLG